MMAAVTGMALLAEANLDFLPAVESGGNAANSNFDFEPRSYGYAIQPTFTFLRLGDIQPAGWLREQMRRDLREGSAGCLDELCSQAAGDIFATGRNTLVNLHPVRGSNAPGWWNGETEGNWRAGFIMLAFLSKDSEAMRKADAFVEHVLAFQDVDGYLGAYSKELRYRSEGDLWTQACLLRGLLSYAELKRNRTVFNAVARCVDGIVAAHAPGKIPFNWGQSHDLMLVDVLERLYDFTGEPRYREFAIRCYKTWSRASHTSRIPGDDDVSLQALLDPKHLFYGHGVRTVEHIRVPLWLWFSAGNKEYALAAQNAVDRLENYLLPSGGISSSRTPPSWRAPEFINYEGPDPFLTECEYCTTKEVQSTFLSALQKTGRAVYAERVERVFFNGAQAGRLQNGSALAYLSPDNRYHCQGTTQDGSKHEPRNKFSPTQEDVAVCCNPSAANVAPLYIRGMWMRHRDGGIAALLYGPCKVSTRVGYVGVELELATNYPFEHRAAVMVRPETETEFNLYFRNPEWSPASSVVCTGAHIVRDGDYWRVRKRWKAGDTVQLEFRAAIRPIVTHNGEIALQYGPLVFAYPIPASAKVVKSYRIAGFQDTYYEPIGDEYEPLAFRSGESKDNFGFEPVLQQDSASTLHPYDEPVIKLCGEMRNIVTQRDVAVELVPIGCAPTLRRETFQAKS
jgi:hypothetical protein